MFQYPAWGVSAGLWEQPHLNNEFQASLGYKARPFLKTEKGLGNGSGLRAFATVSEDESSVPGTDTGQLCYPCSRGSNSPTCRQSTDVQKVKTYFLIGWKDDLRARIALPEDLGLVPSTHVVGQNCQ